MTTPITLEQAECALDAIAYTMCDDSGAEAITVKRVRNFITQQAERLRVLEDAIKQNHNVIDVLAGTSTHEWVDRPKLKKEFVRLTTINETALRLREACQFCGNSGYVQIRKTGHGCCGQFMGSGECCGNSIEVEVEPEMQPCGCKAALKAQKEEE